MTTSDSDRNRSVEYRRASAGIVLYATAGVVVGLFLLAFTDPRENARLAGWILSVLGWLALAWVVWRSRYPGRPPLRLSPAGIDWHNGNRVVRIPWNEVQGIDTATFKERVQAGRRSGTETFEDVTMVMVSQEFHDRHIDPGSTFRRGPYWNVFVRPHKGAMAIALHHEIYDVTPDRVRGPVETRWLAFRNRDFSDVPPDDRFGRGALKFGGTVIAVSGRKAAIVGALMALSLVPLSKIAGLWTLAGW